MRFLKVLFSVLPKGSQECIVLICSVFMQGRPFRRVPLESAMCLLETSRKDDFTMLHWAANHGKKDASHLLPMNCDAEKLMSCLSM